MCRWSVIVVSRKRAGIHRGAVLGLDQGGKKGHYWAQNVEKNLSRKGNSTCKVVA